MRPVRTPSGPPPPLFFGTVHSKGVTGSVSVSAESKGFICTKIVQFSRYLGTADSKGLSYSARDPTARKHFQVIDSKDATRVNGRKNKNASDKSEACLGTEISIAHS